MIIKEKDIGKYRETPLGTLQFLAAIAVVLSRSLSSPMLKQELNNLRIELARRKKAGSPKEEELL
jgi:AmiR/NasT family two-component response regulator